MTCYITLDYRHIVWLSGIVVLDLRLEIVGSIPATVLSSATLSKLFKHIASVTKQYNLE